MAMTAAVKDELARVVVTPQQTRKSEVAAMLRFAGGLHLVAGRVVVEAELDEAGTGVDAGLLVQRELATGQLFAFGLGSGQLLGLQALQLFLVGGLVQLRRLGGGWFGGAGGAFGGGAGGA